MYFDHETSLYNIVLYDKKLFHYDRIQFCVHKIDFDYKKIKSYSESRTIRHFHFHKLIGAGHPEATFGSTYMYVRLCGTLFYGVHGFVICVV